MSTFLIILYCIIGCILSIISYIICRKEKYIEDDTAFFSFIIMLSMGLIWPFVIVACIIGLLFYGLFLLFEKIINDYL
jgi:TRAP-type C4-dicarboxylate transport system permease large subunit